MSARSGPAISVLVATRDRPARLQACVDSLLALEHESFEIVVVDQSESPAELPDDERLVYVHSSTRGKSAGLNIGLSTARGDVLAFTDDDCTVPADWLTVAETVLADHPEVELVFGDLETIEHDPRQVFIPPARQGTFRIVSRPLSAYRRGGAGADMVARRSLFRRIGGYDELIGPGSRIPACEEYDIYYRSLVAGAAVAFAPELTALHWGARPYADGSGQMLLRWYAYGEGAVLGKHVRLGDPRILAAAGRILLEDIGVIVDSLLHRRLSGLGTLAYKVRGFGRGLMTPVDRRRRVFDP
ncbi:MAG: glycosyltransferase [Ilumatobacteraceae bacterium]